MLTWYVYDKDDMSALRIKNTSESDPRSYEVTNKAQKKFWASNGIRNHDLRDALSFVYYVNYRNLVQPANVGFWLLWCSILAALLNGQTNIDILQVQKQIRTESFTS